MSFWRIGIQVLILLISCTAEKKVNNETPETDDKIESPRKEAKGLLDGVAITVDYGSPAVKGRKIWGGLEQFDKVWRAGANETTTISLDKNATINGEPLESGKYALFIIPRKDESWVVIFNTDWDEWGAFRYDEEKDVLRLYVEPSWEDELQERLEYTLAEGQLKFAWEKVRLSMNVAASE